MWSHHSKEKWNSKKYRLVGWDLGKGRGTTLNNESGLVDKRGGEEATTWWDTKRNRPSIASPLLRNPRAKYIRSFAHSWTGKLNGSYDMIPADETSYRACNRETFESLVTPDTSPIGAIAPTFVNLENIFYASNICCLPRIDPRVVLYTDAPTTKTQRTATASQQFGQRDADIRYVGNENVTDDEVGPPNVLDKPRGADNAPLDRIAA